VTSRLAAELERMQDAMRQLDAKSQGQDPQQEETSESHGNTVASKDSGSSGDDDSETSEAAVRSWFKADEKERETQQNEAKLKDQGTSTTPTEVRHQGLKISAEELQAMEIRGKEEQLSRQIENLKSEVLELGTESKQWKSAAQSFEKQTEIHKLWAEMAEKKLKELGK